MEEKTPEAIKTKRAEQQKRYIDKIKQDPVRYEEYKKKLRECQKTYYEQHKDEIKSKRREYLQRPDVQELRRAYRKAYADKPEVRLRLKAYRIEYSKRPEVVERRRTYYREYMRKRLSDPVAREKWNKYCRDYQRRKTLEKNDPTKPQNAPIV